MAHDNVVTLPAAKPDGGEFFAIDRGTFETVNKLGLNPAVAYLTVACGTGRDHSISSWSVNAIEHYTGASRPKANAALQVLIDERVLKRERGGKHPRYRIRHPGKPQWIWLPNAIVKGAADEIPPVRLLRQTQDVRKLRMFVAMYDSNDLPNDGGISRAVLWQTHDLRKEGARGAQTIWAFDPQGRSTVATRSALFTIYVAPNLSVGALDAAKQEFWDAMGALQSVNLVEFVPHIFEGDNPEAELIHAYAVNAGEPWEKELATEAHKAGLHCLTPGQRQWVHDNGKLLFPMPAHMDKVAVIGIARLKYRPRTKMTAAWFAKSRAQADTYMPIYQEIASDALMSRTSAG
jgi:hypothetical protein